VIEQIAFFVYSGEAPCFAFIIILAFFAAFDCGIFVGISNVILSKAFFASCIVSFDISFPDIAFLYFTYNYHFKGST
jgi:hypothetical protein